MRASCLRRVGAEHVGARVQLDLAGAVDEVEERGLAGASAGGEATGDTMAVVGLLAHLQVLVGGANVRYRLDVGVGVGRYVRARLAQPLRLGAPLGDQRGQAVGCVLLLLAHAGELI